MIKILEERRNGNQLLLFIDEDENGSERSVGSVILPETKALHRKQRREIEEVFNRPTESDGPYAPTTIGVVVPRKKC